MDEDVEFEIVEMEAEAEAEAEVQNVADEPKDDHVHVEWAGFI